MGKIKIEQMIINFLETKVGKKILDFLDKIYYKLNGLN